MRHCINATSGFLVGNWLMAVIAQQESWENCEWCLGKNIHSTQEAVIARWCIVQKWRYLHRTGFWEKKPHSQRCRQWLKRGGLSKHQWCHGECRGVGLQVNIRRNESAGVECFGTSYRSVQSLRYVMFHRGTREGTSNIKLVNDKWREVTSKGP